MGLDCVLDRRPDLGPIGGLQAALSECQTPWILAMACDLPGLESRLVETLMAAPQAHDAAVLFGSAGSPEPLFALYHRKLLPRVERAIGQGRRRMTSFLEEGPISGCDSGELRIQWLPCNEKIRAALVNVNRPEDWIQYQSNSQPQKP
jgi:molybdopterin-guanine dinucleotide biosynthesis protein A